jgi:hypothetical protein
MKFTVTMKDPDTLHDAIFESVQEDVLKIEGLAPAERDAVIEERQDAVQALCNKWFEYGEYLRVEIDTDAKTCTVVPYK